MTQLLKSIKNSKLALLTMFGLEAGMMFGCGGTDPDVKPEPAKVVDSYAVMTVDTLKITPMGDMFTGKPRYVIGEMSLKSFNPLYEAVVYKGNTGDLSAKGVVSDIKIDFNNYNGTVEATGKENSYFIPKNAAEPIAFIDVVNPKDMYGSKSGEAIRHIHLFAKCITSNVTAEYVRNGSTFKNYLKEMKVSQDEGYKPYSDYKPTYVSSSNAGIYPTVRMN